MSAALEHELRDEVPAVEDGNPGADVANRDDEVVGLIGRTRGALSTGNVEPDAVLKAGPERRVLGAGSDE